MRDPSHCVFCFFLFTVQPILDSLVSLCLYGVKLLALWIFGHFLILLFPDFSLFAYF